MFKSILPCLCIFCVCFYLCIFFTQQSIRMRHITKLQRYVRDVSNFWKPLFCVQNFRHFSSDLRHQCVSTNRFRGWLRGLLSRGTRVKIRSISCACDSDWCNPYPSQVVLWRHQRYDVTPPDILNGMMLILSKEELTTERQEVTENEVTTSPTQDIPGYVLRSYWEWGTNIVDTKHPLQEIFYEVPSSEVLTTLTHNIPRNIRKKEIVHMCGMIPLLWSTEAYRCHNITKK